MVMFAAKEHSQAPIKSSLSLQEAARRIIRNEGFSCEEERDLISACQRIAASVPRVEPGSEEALPLWHESGNFLFWMIPDENGERAMIAQLGRMDMTFRTLCPKAVSDVETPEHPLAYSELYLSATPREFIGLLTRLENILGVNAAELRDEWQKVVKEKERPGAREMDINFTLKYVTPVHRILKTMGFRREIES